MDLTFSKTEKLFMCHRNQLVLIDTRKAYPNVNALFYEKACEEKGFKSFFGEFQPKSGTLNDRICKAYGWTGTKSSPSFP